jgi:hypothetical protein
VSPIRIAPGTIDLGRKVELLRRAEKAAREAHPSVVQFSASYGDSTLSIGIINNRDQFVGDFVIGISQQREREVIFLGELCLALLIQDAGAEFIQCFLPWIPVINKKMTSLVG